MKFCIGKIQGLTISAGLTQSSAKAGRTITRNTNQAGLLIKGSTDGLANPECGVCGKLKSTAPVKLVDCVLETEVSFLNEI